MAETKGLHKYGLNGLYANLDGMARPYGDPVEILTGPVPSPSPFISGDTKVVLGAVAPASAQPIPIVLAPGFEYRMREWRNPEHPPDPLAAGAQKGHPSGRRRRVTPPNVEPRARTEGRVGPGRRPLHPARTTPKLPWAGQGGEPPFGPRAHAFGQDSRPVTVSAQRACGTRRLRLNMHPLYTAVTRRTPRISSLTPWPD